MGMAATGFSFAACCFPRNDVAVLEAQRFNTFPAAILEGFSIGVLDPSAGPKKLGRKMQGASVRPVCPRRIKYYLRRPPGAAEYSRCHKYFLPDNLAVRRVELRLTLPDGNGTIFW